MKQERQAKQIFWNAMILSAASILMRSAGVAFGVVISNRSGAETMGLYSLLFGVYGFGLTLASSGIHFGVTRVLVSYIAKGKDDKVQAVMKKACRLAFLCGSVGFLFLFFGASPIGIHWLKDERTVFPLRILSFTLIPIALSTVWNGYFNAVGRSNRVALVQMIEQAVKIALTLHLLSVFSPQEPEKSCIVLVMGIIFSETCSFLFGYLLYKRDRHKHFPKNGNGVGIGKELFSVICPVALTTYLRSALLTVEQILIPIGLRNSGASHEAALVAYGSIHSMSLPIVLYPAALIYSFAGLLIPLLSECQVKEERKRISYIVSKVFSLTFLFSIGVSGVLICFSEELGTLLYPGTDAGYYIGILAPLIPIMYVDSATDAMLKGLGEQVYSMKVNVADALISVILVLFLLPKYGIAGYLLTIYCSETFNTVASICKLLNLTKCKVRLLQWIYLPLCSILASTFLVNFLLQSYFPINSFSAWSCVSHILFSVLTYAILLLLTKAVKKEDLKWGKTLFFKEDSDSAMERQATVSTNYKKSLRS